jgi:iron-sulfur cluster repair protein YtfE (RIC family)
MLNPSQCSEPFRICRFRHRCPRLFRTEIYEGGDAPERTAHFAEANAGSRSKIDWGMGTYTMLTQIGQKKESDFGEPIGMLEDCHKRILYFLRTLVTLAATGREQPLDHDRRISLEKALRYFREAAPKHTADEEESLFPRLRRIDTPQVREIFSKLDDLETDHRLADSQHLEVETIGRQWLLTGALHFEDSARLTTVLESLSRLYDRHISLEETEIFSVARTILATPAKQTIGQEMAKRRGVVLSDSNASTGMQHTNHP